MFTHYSFSPSYRLSQGSIQVSIYETSGWCAEGHPDFEQACHMLSDHERARLSRLKPSSPYCCRSKHWALSHALLRSRLSEIIGCPGPLIIFEKGSWGKPLLPDCSFSLSHSGLWIALATGPATNRLGIDIQRVASLKATHSALPYLHPSEQGELTGTPLPQRALLFTQLWARKEAYLKAVGQGLSRNLNLDYLGFDRPASHPKSSKVIDLRHPKWQQAPASLAVLREQN